MMMGTWERKFSRRQVLWLGVGALAGLGGLGAFFTRAGTLRRTAQQWLPVKEGEYHWIRQLITADSACSRRIMWNAQEIQEGAVLEYRSAGGGAVQSAAAVRRPLAAREKISYVYTALAAGLTPSAAYEYRIGHNERRTSWYPLQTADDGPFKALIFPDSQSSDYSFWKQMAQKARTENPDAKFFVNLGDLVDNGEDMGQWEDWFDAVRGMCEQIPIAPVMGNHETYDLDWKVWMPKMYLELFSLPKNGCEAHQNQYYSFDYGSAHFVALNTQFDEMSAFQPELMQTELAWLEEDLARSVKKWKIVLMHKDVLTYAFQSRKEPREAGISEIGKLFMPIFDRWGVDVVLTAHLHTYRRRDHLYNFQPDTKGPAYILTGVAGNVRYPGLWKEHPFDRFAAPQPETDNYLSLEVSADTLRLLTFLPDGKELDRLELYKS